MIKSHVCLHLLAGHDMAGDVLLPDCYRHVPSSKLRMTAGGVRKQSTGDL